MSRLPKVSILIPVYNREDFVLRALDSALKQTYAHTEVVVIDNRSTDNTWNRLLDCAKKDYRIRLFQNEKNLGPFHNWSNGLRQCLGKYVKVLWSDDSIEETFVDECVRILEAREDIALVFSSALIRLADRDISAYHHPQKTIFSSQEYLLKTILAENMPRSPGCCLLRKKDARFFAFQGKNPRLNEISEKFGAGPDVFFMLHAASLYPYVSHIPKFLSHFYGNANSFTIAHRQEVEEGYRLLFNHLLNDYENTSFRKLKMKIRCALWKKKCKKFLRLNL